MNQLIHIPYEKIVEDLDKYTLTEKDYRLLRKQKWVVTEKIHGAHLCIHTNGSIVAYAKRKEILSPGDEFFHYEILKPELDSKILKLYSRIKQDFPGITQLSVHGELFGGEYPHPEVDPVPGVQAIQTGVFYSPGIRFCAFDMALINPDGIKTFINYHKFSGYAEQVSLFYSHALFTGSLHDVLLYNIDFETTIPAFFGFPSLGSHNKAEGIVIKPENPFLLETGKGNIRPVIKRKIREFSEDMRYHQAQKWNKWQQITGKNRYVTDTSKGMIVLSDSFIKEEIDPLVTPQRLANTVSKIGRINKKNKSRILRALIEDIIEELVLRFKESYSQLGKDEKKKIYVIIKEKCKELMVKK